MELKADSFEMRGDPVGEEPDVGVDPGDVVGPAADAPRRDSDQVEPLVAGHYAGKRSTSVALARVLIGDSSGAVETLVQNEVISESSFAELGLALARGNVRQRNLLHHVLILRVTGEGVLAPAGSDTASRIRRAFAGEADKTDVISEGEGGGQFEESHVVVEGAVVESGVEDHLSHPLLLVG